MKVLGLYEIFSKSSHSPPLAYNLGPTGDRGVPLSEGTPLCQWGTPLCRWAVRKAGKNCQKIFVKIPPRLKFDKEFDSGVIFSIK